jgi:tRNA threonylcarbamoyl adenosine modification protein YjeE
MTPEQWQLTLETTSVEETEAAGVIVGRGLTGGEVIALEGGLGAGKTVFIRGLARGLEIPEDEISSPTFVFLHEHHGRLPLAHIDLYRIESPSDATDLGITDYLEGSPQAWPGAAAGSGGIGASAEGGAHGPPAIKGSWVAAIEWAEKAAGFLPDHRLTIRMSETGTRRRRLVLSTRNSFYEAILKALRERFCAKAGKEGTDLKSVPVQETDNA